MRRKRMREEMERERTEIKAAIDELSLLLKLRPPPPPSTGTTAAAAVTVVDYFPTQPFLSVCHLILPVLDKIGPTMAVLRQDIFRNIQRVEMLWDSNPAKYSNLVEMLKVEAGEGKAKKGDSCSKALVWLSRCMDFTAALLEKMVTNPGLSMEQVVDEAYSLTLKPWHGWISAAAYKVALKLVPDSTTFMSLLVAKDESFDSLKEEIQALLSVLLPTLKDMHSILSSYGLDRLKST